MAEKRCARCSLRARFDNNPASLLGRLWRWHINFCPGWKRYFLSLPPDEQARLADRYAFRKYR